MSISVGTSSNALSYLQQLLQQGTAGASGAANATDPLSILLQSISGSSTAANQTSSATGSTNSTTSSSSPPFGSDTMAALISLQGQSANSLVAQSPSQLFSKIDTDGDGQISKTEFENALSGAGVSTADADTLFAKLDTNGDGTVSQDELTKAAQGHQHHHMHGGGGAQGSSDQNPLDALLSGAGADGATTQTATNADGSTTTTISYADGTKIDMTTPVASSKSGTSSNGSSSDSTSNQSTANLLEQLIQLQSQLLTAATSTLSTIA